MKLKKIENALWEVDARVPTSTLTIIPSESEGYNHYLRIARTQIAINEMRLLIENASNTIVIPRGEISQFCFEPIGSDSHLLVKTKRGCVITIHINSEGGGV